MKTIHIGLLIGLASNTFLASESSLMTDWPPITISEQEMLLIQKNIPLLQNLVDDIISKIETYPSMEEKFGGLNRFKAVQEKLAEVDDNQNPVLLNSLEGQMSILSWLIHCSAIQSKINILIAKQKKIVHLTKPTI